MPNGGVQVKFDRSREMYEESLNLQPGGVHSSARLGEMPVPLYFDRAKGSKLIDVDGNEFIDYVLGMGPAIFGHAPDFLVDAVSEAMGTGLLFAGQQEIEVEIGRMVTEIVPCAEMIRFASSGTEVDEVVIRLARAYTGRQKFIRFEGHYHGWSDVHDWSVHPSLEEAGPDHAPVAVPEAAGMSPSAGEDIIVLPWNDLDILRKTVERQRDEIAAIIQEPIVCSTNTIVPKPGYLEGMRRLCDDHGIVMIFDEVVTGFRVAAGGAQELLGVTPDLATYAKAMSGGFPVAMMAGKREIMSLLGDGTVHHGGALNSNRVNMAAVLASLRKFTENDNAMYKPLYATGNKLMERLRRLGDKHEQPILVQGPGPVFTLAFTDAKEITDYRSHVRNADEKKYERFQQGMLERGVRLFPRGFWFVSTAHTDEDVERTLAAADEVLASL